MVECMSRLALLSLATLYPFCSYARYPDFRTEDIAEARDR
jgi:hypothetical protein